MAWFFTTITGFLISMLTWLVKKFGVSKLVLVFQISVSVIYVTFVLSAITFIMLFVFEVWNLFTQVISSFSVVPNIAGDSFGVSNQDLISSFLGFLDASGIAPAFITAGNLFIGLLSAFFVVKSYYIFMLAIREIKKVIDTLLVLVSRSSISFLKSYWLRDYERG